MRSVACISGAGEVQGDTGLAQVRGRGLRPGPQAGTGGVGQRQGRVGLRDGRRSYAADPPPPRCPEVRQGRPHEADAREQVRLHRLQDGLVIAVERARCRWAAGVRHDDVETAETVDRDRNEVLGRPRIGHVRPDGHDFRAPRLESPFGMRSASAPRAEMTRRTPSSRRAPRRPRDRDLGRRCDHSDPSLETEFHAATSLSLPAGGRRGRL